jgi:hypothetical protein
MCEQTRDVPAGVVWSRSFSKSQSGYIFLAWHSHMSSSCSSVSCSTFPLTSAGASLMASTLHLREVSSSSTFHIRSSAGATWGLGSSLLLDSEFELSN